MNFALVFIGGGFGSLMRYSVGLFAVRLLGSALFPWGTLFVNVFGCFLMGILAIWLHAGQGDMTSVRVLLGVGVLGGFTTFSAFALETFMLMESHLALALGYMAGSVIISLGALFLGIALGRILV
jgi:fluoride exporter